MIRYKERQLCERKKKGKEVRKKKRNEAEREEDEGCRQTKKEEAEV